MTALILVLALSAPPLYEMDEAEVDRYVREQASALPDFEARLAAAAHDALGTACVDGPLGEGPDAEYDPDPLIDLTRVDCVTYIEQSIALSAGSDYDDMFDTLQRIRYANNAIDYESRNHFFVSDWIENNTFCTDVTTGLGVPTRSITRTISKRGFFERVDAPGLGVNEPDRRMTIEVVTPGDAEAAEGHLPDTAIIVFVGNVDWLFALHTGLYIRGDDGAGKLYHASSKAGEVVAVDLSAYLEEQAERYAGFAAYEIGEPEFAE